MRFHIFGGYSLCQAKLQQFSNGILLCNVGRIMYSACELLAPFPNAFCFYPTQTRRTVITSVETFREFFGPKYFTEYFVKYS